MEENQIIIALAMIIFAGVTVLIVAMLSRYKLREMEHRERLAMIERGLVPSPERDPAGFESRSGMHPDPTSRAAQRTRSMGVITIGLGIALMLLIMFSAGSLAVGTGVGGAIAVLGVAFYINGTMMERRHAYDYRSPASRSAGFNTPPEPPSNVAP